MSSRARSRWLLAMAFVLVVGATLSARFVRDTYDRASGMPGSSFRADPGPATADEAAVAAALEATVGFLSDELGPRSSADVEARAATLAWLEERLGELGLEPEREVFGLLPGADEAGRTNLVLRFPAPRPDAPWVVLSAHYDTVPESPGADDDASGVATLLELARALAARPLADQVRHVELVFFDAEEAGWDHMGSGFHAQALEDAGQTVAVAISLEMLGYFTEEPGSQEFPAPFLSRWYPDRGNFLAFVGNRSSESAIRAVIGAFRETARVASEGLAAPDSIEDVGRSDHAQFWSRGWPGLMLTDTADFRNANYHEPSDVTETLDYLRMARITVALDAVLRDLSAGLEL